MSESLINTAVVPIAGLGTRMAPFTAGVPKFMAPISEGNRSRPNIDYTLDDCIGAGIENIIFIVSNGGEEQLRKYLGEIDPEVVRSYESVHKHKELQEEVDRRAAFASMNIEYVKQTGDKYGTAVPLNAARVALKGVRNFAVTGGDDFIWHGDGTSELALAIETWQKHGTQHAIMGKSVTRADAPKYGILQVDEQGQLINIDEKPPISRVPTHPLANVSRYILESESIWPFLDQELNTPRTTAQPEYYLTDVLNAAVEDGQTFQTHLVKGTYLDAGSPQGILQASLFLSEQTGIK